MADIKVSAMEAATTAASPTDLVYLVLDAAASPKSRKITVEDVMLNVEKSFTFTVGASNTWNNELLPVWRAPKSTSATLISVYPTTSGGGELDFNFQRRDALTVAGPDIWAASQHATSDSAAKAGFATSAIGPLNYLMFTTGSGAEGGSVTHFTATVYYK